MRLLVTASNPDATVTATSTPTVTIPSAPPVNTVRPAISGTAQRASTLTGSPGTWSGIGNGYAYQWQRSSNGTTWVDIAGATATGYELTVADVGASVRLLVTATNPDGDRHRHEQPDRDDPQRGAREHRPAGDQRHRSARVDADRHGRHLDRHRQQHAPTSGSAPATARPGSTSRARRARPMRS